MLQFIKNALIYFIIYSLPYLFFLKTNVDELNIVLVKSFFFLYFFLLFFLILVAYILSIVLKHIQFNQSLLIIGIFYFMLFQHNSILILLKDIKLISDILGNIISEFILIFIIFSSTLMSLVLLKKKIFKNFLYIFFVLNFIFISIDLIISINPSDQYKQTGDTKISGLKKTEIINLENKPNIYFLILDSMIPFKQFEEEFDYDLSHHRQIFENKGYRYFENTTNFYNNTTHSLSAIFYLDKIFDNDGNLKNEVKTLFPTLMKKGNPEPKLIELLNDTGYKFKWAGNYFAHCPKFNITYCLNQKHNKFIDLYLFINFFKQSPLIQVINKLSGLFDYDLNKHVFFELNNGIGRLLNYLDNENNLNELESTFYFIHHMSPHYPYLTKSDCSYKFTPGEFSFEGYKSAYLCDINRISSFIDYIKKKDHNAYVIFQSDHGWKLKDTLSKKKDIFNLVKLNNDCKFDNDINYNNVNILRLVFSCILNTKPKYIY